jgi:hypothetical protein
VIPNDPYYWYCDWCDRRTDIDGASVNGKWLCLPCAEAEWEDMNDIKELGLGEESK